MDADDISMPDRIEKQFFYLEKNPNINACSSYVFVIDENGYNIGTRKVPVDSNKASVQCIFKTPLIHPASIIKRVVNGKVIQYDESFKYSQDFALWSSLPVGTIANIPEYLLKYRESSSQISTHLRKDQLDCARQIQIRNLEKGGIKINDQFMHCYDALINRDKRLEAVDAGIIDCLSIIIKHFDNSVNKKLLFDYLAESYIWYLYKYKPSFIQKLVRLVLFYYRMKSFSLKSVFLYLYLLVNYRD